MWTVNDKWKRVGAIAKNMGFEWGGDWTSFKDYPHLQFNRGLTISQLKHGMSPAFPQLVEENPGKVMWGKTELKPGQKGKITVLQDINVWEDSPHGSGEIIHTRTLKKGGEFRVYNYRPDHGGQYYLGAGEWLTKMPEYIKYETPSKAILERLNCK